MNRGGAGAGAGSGSGPTVAAAVQKQRALLQRVETDIGHIVDNFSHLVNVARVNDPPVRHSQEAFMMEMRAARMVQAADSLLKLVSELKQTAIFSGFASLNDHVEQRIVEFNQQAEKSDRTLSRIAEEAAASLKELESHYYANLHDIGELLSSLSVLCLQCCVIQYSQFSAVRCLSELELENCLLAETVSLDNLRRLELLKISHCYVRTLDGLENLPRFRRLTLDDCPSLTGPSLTGLPDRMNRTFEIDGYSFPEEQIVGSYVAHT